MNLIKPLIYLPFFVALSVSSCGPSRTLIDLNRYAMEDIRVWQEGARSGCSLPIYQYFPGRPLYEKQEFENCVDLKYLTSLNLMQEVFALEDVRILSLPRGVRDLTGIEAMQSLRRLSLYRESNHRGIEMNLEPIASLNSLNALAINTGAYSGPEALGAALHLPELETLFFEWDYPNLPDLSGVPKLKRLDVHGDGPTNLEGISLLRNLQYLRLSPRGGNLDISPLANIASLRKLDLSRSDISNLYVLRTLPQLHFLNLGSTNVEDVSALSSLKYLISLDLERTHVEDISPLASLQRLQSLDLSGGTPVIDLAPLASLKSLRHLDLRGLEHLDLSPLARLKNLESVSGVWEKADPTQFEELRALGVPFVHIVFEP